MRWIVRGDIDGFFGVALDNLVQLPPIDEGEQLAVFFVHQ
jgi:hypothetical protein